MTSAIKQFAWGSMAAFGVTLIAVSSRVAEADAMDHFWEAIGGGDFNDPVNWVDGNQFGAPGFDDTARFDLAAAYTVTFGGAQFTDRVVVSRGLVTFALADVFYTLLNPLTGTPSIVVGDGDLDTAALTITGGTVHGRFTDLGRMPGAFGSLTVTGPAAELINDWQVRVGHQGAGLLELSDGAIASNGAALIAAGSGSFGDAVVTGPATVWDCAGGLTAGKGGFGSLLVSDGAAVLSSDGIIGQQLASIGEVTVNGAGSSWTIDGTLDVGLTGFGTLTIQDGGAVTNEIFATVGTFPVQGTGEGAVGEIVISGSGSSWTVNGDLYLGFAGFGRWTFSEGGSVTVNGDLLRGAWLSDSGTPQTIIELGDAGDYATAAITVSGGADGFEPRVDLINGFVPQRGDTFLIATAGVGLGTFVFDLPPLPRPLDWEVVQDADSVELRVVTLFATDITGDGVVDVLDLIELLLCFGMPADPPCDTSDVNLDGAVNVLDLIILLMDFD